MICATCKHRIWSECAGAGAVLHLVAAEFDDGVRYRVFEVAVHDLFAENVGFHEHAVFFLCLGGSAVGPRVDQTSVKPSLVDREDVGIIFWERNRAFLRFFPIATKCQAYEVGASSRER